MSISAHHNNSAAPPLDAEFDNQFDELEDDAPLNPDSLDAQTINWIIAQLTNPDVNILDVAASLNCSPASLLEIITHAAEFRSHIDAMRDLALLSAQIIASDSLPRHTDTLIRIADDESVHPETRRKAIGALIRLARGMTAPTPPRASGAPDTSRTNNHMPRATSRANGTAGAPSSPPSSSSRSVSFSDPSSGATGGLSTSASRSPSTPAFIASPPFPKGGGVMPASAGVTEGVSQSIATTDSSQSADSEPRASARACRSDSPSRASPARNNQVSGSESPNSCSPVQPSNTRATSRTNGTAGAPSSSIPSTSSCSSAGSTAPPPLPVPGEGGGVTRSVTEGVSQSIATTDSSQSIDSEPRHSARACTPESPEPQPTARIDHISDSALHDTDPRNLEHSDSPLHQYIDELLTLDDEALFKEARAAARALLDLGIIPRTTTRAGPDSAVA